MPFISVILPVKNSANTIKVALTSILSQTFLDFEILILDNLSNDDTISIVEKIDSDRILKLYYN